MIVVLGSINTDFVIRSPRLPRPGETVVADRFFQTLGGKGANSAVAATRAGRKPVALVGAVGNDAFGHAALAGLKGERVDCRFVKVAPEQSSGVAFVMVDQHGENCISVTEGANAGLTQHDIDAMARELFAQACVVIANFESPPEIVARFLRTAKEYGLKTILNPAPLPTGEVDPEILADADIVTPNEHEAQALTGIEISDERSLERAAQRLRQLGCLIPIITLGGRGAFLYSSDAALLPAAQVAAVDATAAGDCFIGALAVALSENEPLHEAVRFAVAAATLSVTRAGAQPSLPLREEIDAVLK